MLCMGLPPTTCQPKPGVGASWSRDNVTLVGHPLRHVLRVDAQAADGGAAAQYIIGRRFCHPNQSPTPCPHPMWPSMPGHPKGENEIHHDSRAVR